MAVTDSVYTDTYTGNDGADGAAGRTGESGGNGGKMVLELTGSENVANNISFIATGGNGGEGMMAKENSSIPFGGNGGSKVWAIFLLNFCSLLIFYILLSAFLSNSITF